MKKIRDESNGYLEFERLYNMYFLSQLQMMISINNMDNIQMIYMQIIFLVT